MKRGRPIKEKTIIKIFNILEPSVLKIYVNMIKKTKIMETDIITFLSKSVKKFKTKRKNISKANVIKRK